MIRLRKLPEPNYLRDNADLWTQRLIEREAEGVTPTATELNRYNHPAIKLALVAETAGKCAYCESKILHVAFGDIEHIIPKSSGAEHRFAWDNLTLACGICNTKKSNLEGLVDPYQMDPSDVFSFMGPLVFATDGDGIGYRTYVVLDLNRENLRERRYNRISYIESLIQILRKTSDEVVADVLRRDIREEELADTTEFAAAARAFVRARCPDIFDTD